MALPFIKEPHSPKDMIAWISNTVVPRSSTWVICIGDLIAGFMTFDQSRIEHLYLEPAETRQGLGSQLLEFAKSGRRLLSLYCFAENHAACRFYEYHGFKAVAHGEGSKNEEGAPDILYEWRDSKE
ncbi:MAG: GNAT family N-acetyltransferase [Pseudomonadota bacterium]